MPVMRRETVLAGGTTLAFFNGDPYEIPQRPMLCNAGFTGNATGLVLAITVGSRLIQVESPVDILGTFPVIPDQMGVTYVAMANERQVFQVRNTTGGNLTARGLVLLQDA